MLPLRSLVFNAAFYVWTALIVILGLPIALMPYPAVYWLGRAWVRGALWLLRRIVGPAPPGFGLDHGPPPPAIYAAKHQSSWDTLVFALSLQLPAYVLKRELLYLPLFGLFLLRAGHIPVDRTGRAVALK